MVALSIDISIDHNIQYKKEKKHSIQKIVAYKCKYKILRMVYTNKTINRFLNKQ